MQSVLASPQVWRRGWSASTSGRTPLIHTDIKEHVAAGFGRVHARWGCGAMASPSGKVRLTHRCFTGVKRML